MAEPSAPKELSRELSTNEREFAKALASISSSVRDFVALRDFARTPTDGLSPPFAQAPTILITATRICVILTLLNAVILVPYYSFTYIKNREQDAVRCVICDGPMSKYRCGLAARSPCFFCGARNPLPSVATHPGPSASLDAKEHVQFLRLVLPAV